MSLTDCKECKKEVAVEAEICPNCGIKEPGVSQQERKLLFERKSLVEQIEYYEEEARALSSGFLGIFRQKIANEGIGRANNARRQIERVDKEISELRSKKWY